MDDVDRRLAAELRANARATYAELARAVGLSAPAVHERVAKLEAAGVITGYHAGLDPVALGQGLTALIGILITDSADIDALTAAFEAEAPIVDCWFVAGEETFVLRIVVPDVGGLEAVIRDLNRIPGVARTRTTVVLSAKFEQRLPIGAEPGGT
jgi:Lrp/AsnC family transcriptional regulator, leucine-responsive regulatory protein